MKKTVVYKNDKIKVDFVKDNHTRIIDKTDGIRIIKAHGTHDFIINGKKYVTLWTMNYKTKPSVQLHFEGFTCAHSEKKIIEHIISKYGI